jgi:hypothetical protein
VKDSYILALLWVAVVAHGAAGLAVVRRLQGLSLVVALNTLVALLVILYWVPKWHSYAFRGINWYWTDQFYPLWAVVVLGVGILSFLGRGAGNPFHWVIFGCHLLVLLGAALFFSFFRLDRLF